MKSSLHEQKSDKLLFRFEYTQEAALHNAIVLQCCNFDMNLAIQALKNSQVYYGSKFKPPDIRRNSGKSPSLEIHKVNTINRSFIPSTSNTK